MHNARGSRNGKSRKDSMGKISDLPPKTKKPRKMTLSIESNREFSILEEGVNETYS